MRVVVIGNSGAGKSRYARALAVEHGLEHLDLDGIVWEPAMVAVRRSDAEVVASLEAFVRDRPGWVVEGCYTELARRLLPVCTRLVFLNPGREACLRHNLSRPWEPHKYATAEAQAAMLERLQAWVAGYYERDDEWSYRAHRVLFDAFEGAKVEHLQPLSDDERRARAEG